MSIRLPRARLYLAALLCLFAANVFAEDSRTLAATRTAAPASEKKVALVIGNAAYRENPLRNPVNDARAMSAKLKKLGFEVITHENVTALKYGAVLREFRSKLSPGAVALFFYAGHGLQVNGKNYLPAVDAQIQGEEDVPMQSLDLNLVLNTLEDSKTRMNLVFLDACRNNPYARSFRSAAGGLARVEAPSGTLISYATRPGSVAADGTGANGLYTTQLLKHMDARGQPVEQVLKRVVGGVSDASRGAQEPWMEGSIRGDFYFVPGAATATTQGADTAIPTLEQDNQLWAETKQAGTLEAYQWYLEKFPDGLRAGLARNEISKRERTNQPAPQAAPTTTASANKIAYAQQPAPAAKAGGHAGGDDDMSDLVRTQMSELTNQAVQLANTDLSVGDAFLPYGVMQMKNGELKQVRWTMPNPPAAQEVLKGIVVSMMKEAKANPNVISAVAIGPTQTNGTNERGESVLVTGLSALVDHRNGAPRTVFMPYIRKGSAIEFGTPVYQIGPVSMFDHSASQAGSRR